MCFAKRFFSLAAIAWLAFQSSAGIAADGQDGSPSLNTAIWQAAKRTEGWLRDNRCASVAVLKFDTYAKGDQRTRHDLGPIHINLARRLERGLIVVQRPKDMNGQPQSEIVVALDANATAAETRGADLNTAPGRRALSSATYRPAWGTGSLQPDALVTGMLRFDESGSHRAVLIVLGFLRQSPDDVVKVGEFSADLAVQDLIDTGRSFSTRGVFDGGKVEVVGESNSKPVTLPASSSATVSPSLEQALALAAVQAQTEPNNSPLVSPRQPIRLRIFYGDREQPLETVGGEIVVPEPAEGTPIHIRVERQGTDKPRLGIVLKVNGENSFGREREPDFKCTKWIMEPQLDRFAIRGFQLNNTEQVTFRVAGREESRRVESQFGTDVGTISLTVFGEQGTTAPQIEPTQLVQGTKPIPPLPKAVDPNNTRPLDLMAIAEGAMPSAPSRDRVTCQLALRQTSGATRGLIQGGDSKVVQVESTIFTANPLPLMSATVRYYRKQLP